MQEINYPEFTTPWAVSINNLNELVSTKYKENSCKINYDNRFLGP